MVLIKNNPIAVSIKKPGNEFRVLSENPGKL